MQKVRVAGFGVSFDGFSAGIEQSLSDPLGKRGTEIFQWFFRTKTFRAMLGQEGGVVDTDDEFARKAMDNFGAFILGRNMFGPVRGPWLDRSWKGWWGDNPPYHTPTFVLTHYEHEHLVMEGGQAGEVYELGDDTVIGRSNGDIVFPHDGFMSGRHARIVRRGGSFVLADERSRNGTFVKISGEVELKPGDMILVGKQLFRFEL